jgi:predicted nucleotidyltransferase
MFEMEARSHQVDINILEKLIDLCKKESAVLAAYLFGSYATGSKRASSDLDIAILLRQDLADAFPLLAFISALDRLCRRRVDVVVLNRAGEVLKYQVRKSGRLIFDRAPQERARFEVRSRKFFEDFLHLHRRYAKAVLYGSPNG